MTPLTVTPQSPAPLTLTVRSPTLGVAARTDQVFLRGTPDRWRIDFGAAPDTTPAVAEGILTEGGDALTTEASDQLTTES